MGSRHSRAGPEGRMGGETPAPGTAIRDGQVALSAPSGLSSQCVYGAQRPTCSEQQSKHKRAANDWMGPARRASAGS